MLLYKHKEKNKEDKKMYSVWMADDMFCDDAMVFEGTLEECLTYTAEDELDEMYIVEPDGFTVYEG